MCQGAAWAKGVDKGSAGTDQSMTRVGGQGGGGVGGLMAKEEKRQGGDRHL